MYFLFIVTKSFNNFPPSFRMHVLHKKSSFQELLEDLLVHFSALDFWLSSNVRKYEPGFFNKKTRSVEQSRSHEDSKRILTGLSIKRK